MQAKLPGSMLNYTCISHRSYYSHPTDEETEVETGYMTCSRSYGWSGGSASDLAPKLCSGPLGGTSVLDTAGLHQVSWSQLTLSFLLTPFPSRHSQPVSSAPSPLSSSTRRPCKPPCVQRQRGTPTPSPFNLPNERRA